MTTTCIADYGHQKRTEREGQDYMSLRDGQNRVVTPHALLVACTAGYAKDCATCGYASAAGLVRPGKGAEHRTEWAQK
eukprot:1160017-Pelagomonas_calceolata.AAC.6